MRLLQLSTRHDGVAVAASPSFSGIKGGGFTPEDQALIDEDERRVFDMLTPHFTYFATESVVRQGSLGQAALYHFLPRAPGMSRETFAGRYRGDHAAVAGRETARIAGLTRAALNHPVHDPLPLFPFDGISECWFDTAGDAARALSDGSFDEITRDLASFCDLDAGVLMLTSVSHRWSDI